MIRVHVGEHDAANGVRVDSEFLPGGLPAGAQLGPVEAGVEDRPAVTVAQQVAVDVIQGEGERLAQLVDVFGGLTQGVLRCLLVGRLLVGRLLAGDGGGCAGHDLRALVDR